MTSTGLTAEAWKGYSTVWGQAMINDHLKPNIFKTTIVKDIEVSKVDNITILFSFYSFF